MKINNSFEIYLKKAELGDAEAQYQLAFCYYKGDGVKQDYSEAFKWWKKAAEQGDAKAQNELGECFFYGNYIPVVQR